MKKTINAQLNVKLEEVDQFLALSKVLVEKSNMEPGVLVYRLFQEVGQPSKFFVYEEYENQAAIDNHNASEHFKTFIDGVGGILSNAPIIEVH